MGICLDTDQRNDGQADEFEYNQYGNARARQQAWQHEQSPGIQDYRYTLTPPEGRFPMQNAGHIKFEVPKVPVIFVLGGPGSGKVTHCDNLMQERRGVVHINMTDLLHQYSMGNEMQDFAQLSSKTVTEVLMLEMKMAPSAKMYLVSGYPRNMRDVVEYSNKIQIVNGVILVDWRQEALERQVEYGAQLGHVVLSLARMELDNFYRNVKPVADFFDQRKMLVAVNGERYPNEVYADFRTAVLHILGADMTNTLPQGEWPAPTMDRKSMPNNVGNAPTYRAPGMAYPCVIWVIGGPGSNKSSLCQKAVRQSPGWAHVSIGRLLRAAAESTDPRQSNEALLVRQSVSAGEMVAPAYVMQLVETHLNANINAKGILIDGFPRDMNQVVEFESKTKQQPVVLLLDCSKLQLGRGRLDDTVAAFRRRLELFRELTLPMLRTMDQENRLTIVDGDTDSKPVQDEFFRAIKGHMEQIRRSGGLIVPEQHDHQEAQRLLPRVDQQYDTMLHDLEAEDDHQIGDMVNVPVRNRGYTIGNGVAMGVSATGPAGGLNNGSLFGGAINPPGRTRVPVQVINGGYGQRPRHMYADVETYPADSHI